MIYYWLVELDIELRYDYQELYLLYMFLIDWSY